MSLEPITKKDIENLFNKILRVQVKRQRISNDVISVSTSHSRTSGNLDEEQVVQEEYPRLRGDDELLGFKAEDWVFKNYENDNIENKKMSNTKRRKKCRI